MPRTRASSPAHLHSSPGTSNSPPCVPSWHTWANSSVSITVRLGMWLSCCGGWAGEGKKAGYRMTVECRCG